ncbi:immunity 49 family protein [Kitasatospora sp. NPDC001660]
MVYREKKRVKGCARYPLSMLRESGAKSAEFDCAWIDVLQTYWIGGADLIPKLGTAIDATDPETVADPETVTHLVYPPVELFHRFIRGNHAGFNRALVDALEWRKRYWSRAARASGLVALAPLAMHPDRGPVRVPAQRSTRTRLVRRVSHVGGERDTAGREVTPGH